MPGTKKKYIAKKTCNSGWGSVRDPARISRRGFLQRGALASAGLLAQSCYLMLLRISRSDFDLVIRRGEIVDGTGSWAFRADLGVKDGRIAAIGNLERSRGLREIDARHLIVAPGFIDIHSHSDLSLLYNGGAHSKIFQGVTTEIVGQDGRSVAPVPNGAKRPWRDFRGYYRRLIEQGISVNVRSMVGAAALRQCVIGSAKRVPTPSELSRMKALLLRSQSEGALGLSSGLEYLPGAYADFHELSALARPAGLYATHMRNEDDSVIFALMEAIKIARLAGARLHISHIKAQGRLNWPHLDEMLDMLQVARAGLGYVSCDRYPYLAYNTRTANLFPLFARKDSLARFLSDPERRERTRKEVEDKIASLGGADGVLLSSIPAAGFGHYKGFRLSEIVRMEGGGDPYDLLCKIMIQSSGQGSMVGFGMSEENLEKLLKYKYCAIASDGAALQAGRAPYAHPRSFGTFPKVLGHYVRNKGILSIEEAVFKMTWLPARIMGIPFRGQIKQGYFADLVILDPDRVASRATYLQPDRYPEGIPYVIVNGTPVVHEGHHTGATPGWVV